MAVWLKNLQCIQEGDKVICAQKGDFIWMKKKHNVSKASPNDEKILSPTAELSF